MKKTFTLICCDEVLAGIELLQDELEFQLDPKASLTVEAKKAEEEILQVSFHKNRAVITYGKGKNRFFRGLMLLCKALDEKKKTFYAEEHPAFTMNGSMFDMSRNAVMKPETVKAILRKQALMGLNMFMLYTEDTYEVPDNPYFGYQRGRYSASEIRDMDDYADALGIELIPCIQVLGHMAMALKWNVYAPVRDTHDILRIGAPKTYQLMDQMFAGISSMFRSRRIHVGMDEALFLGHGRYLSYGVEPKPQDVLFVEHMQETLKIAQKYGLKPMMWSDMLFVIAGAKNHHDANVVFTPAMLEKIPREIQQVYWAYADSNQKNYEAVFDAHKLICNETVFAGGIWTWMSSCPRYSLTLEASLPALKACINKGIKEVIATVWHNGADGTLINSLYGLQMYAEMEYRGEYVEEQVMDLFAYTCKANGYDFFDMEKADHPNQISQRSNCTRYFLFNDPLLGLLDDHAKGVDNPAAFYRELRQEFQNKGPKTGLFAESFRYFRAILDVLEYKVDFGIRLREAYLDKDMEAIGKVYEDSKLLGKRIENLRKVHRQSWMYYNKPQGFEVFDLFYGGLQARLDTVRYHLDFFQKDSSYRIGELEEERLPFVAYKPETKGVVDIGFRFGRLFTPAVLYTVYNEGMIG